MEIARVSPGAELIDVWFERSLVWYDPKLNDASGLDTTAPSVPAWRFRGRSVKSPLLAVTVFVDATTGGVLEMRDDVFQNEITGKVTALGTPVTRVVNGVEEPWAQPYNPADTLVVFPLPDLLVEIEDATPPETDFTDMVGDFSIPTGATGPVRVTGRLDDGLWFDVDTSVGSVLSAASAFATPPADADIAFNVTAPNEYTTAQVNAFVHANGIRNLIRSRTSWTGADQIIRLLVNDPDLTCNASYSGGTLAFGQSTAICPNSAYSPVVAHEYGHFIVERLGLDQHAFGEGFGDCCGVLYSDDPRGERDYSPGQPERLWPCAGYWHDCGQVLGGFWRDIRENMGVRYGSVAGLEKTRDLFVRWLLITGGGSSTLVNGTNYFQSAQQLTVQEVIAIDDDPDGNPANGTVNSPELCMAASAHNLAAYSPSKHRCVYFTPPAGINVSFHRPVQLYVSPFGIDPSAVAAANLHGSSNSYLDVVLGCAGSDNMLVYYVLSAGPDSVNFTEPPTVLSLDAGARPGKLFIAEVDGHSNGLPDIVVTATLQHAVYVFENRGPGQPWVRQGPLYLGEVGNLIAQRPIGVAVANWDTDPRADIAVACTQTIGGQDWASIAVLWNYAGGSFTNKSVIRMSTVATEGLGRGFDLTIWTDSYSANRLAMTNFQVGQDIPLVAHVIDNPSGTPPPIQVLFPMRLSRGIAVGDFDPGTDTLPDLACVESNSQSLPWWKQYSNGVFDVGGQPQFGYFTELNGWGLDAGRLSKIPSMPFQLDATDDLVVGSSHDHADFFPLRNAVNILASTGLSSDDDLFVSMYAYVTESTTTQQCFPTEVQIADVNADGFPDIVTANRGNSPLTVADDEFEGFSVLVNRK